MTDRKILVSVAWRDFALTPPQVMLASELPVFLGAITLAALTAPGGEFPTKIVTRPVPVDEVSSPCP